jgi:septum formation protein
VTIILASASNRRKEILQSLDLDFQIIPSQLDEERFKQKVKDPKELALELALAKAREVRRKVKAKEFLIIAADTFVVLDDQVINKPRNRQEAEKMLWLLSGKTHQVLTGLVLLDHKGRQKKALAISEVVFKKLTAEEIRKYLNTGVFKDRAGAYGIQDPKCDFVKNVKGSYTNIVGLPLKELKKLLKEFGINPFSPAKCGIRRGEGGEKIW